MPVEKRDVERILTRTRARSPRPITAVYMDPQFRELMPVRTSIALRVVREMADPGRGDCYVSVLTAAARLMSVRMLCQNESGIQVITSDYGPDIIKACRRAGQLGVSVKRLWDSLPPSQYLGGEKGFTSALWQEATDEFFSLGRNYRRDFMRTGVVISSSHVLEGIEAFALGAIGLILGDEGVTAFATQFNGALADLRAILQKELDEEAKKSAQP